jgi:hypothetical protein
LCTQSNAKTRMEKIVSFSLSKSVNEELKCNCNPTESPVPHNE